MERTDAKAKQVSRAWWNANPMVYDWDRTLKAEEGTLEFYQAIDRRLHEALPEVHTKGSYSALLDAEALVGKRVLVVGCGAGVEAEALSRRGASVTAVDLTQKAVHLTRTRLRLHGLHGALLNGDAEELPFKDAVFDLVWSWGVIHHSPNMQSSAKEIFRVLKPGGKAMIMIYRKDSINYWIGLMLIRGVLLGKLVTMTPQEICNRYSDGSLAKYYSPAMIRDLFAHFPSIAFSGFSQLGGIYPLPRRWRQWLARLTPVALTQWLKRTAGDFLFFEARK